MRFDRIHTCTGGQNFFNPYGTHNSCERWSPTSIFLEFSKILQKCAERNFWDSSQTKRCKKISAQDYNLQQNPRQSPQKDFLR